ncbi:MAG: DUF1538 domain-containing protein [Eubacteriales bacterium]|nr:DUF1538 domain-containing protein [Eubacteriales bacterium]
MFLLSKKIREAGYSVLPIVLMVALLHITVAPLTFPHWIRFLLGACLIVLGLAVFLLGVDVGLAPIGQLTGSALAKTNKISLVIAAGLLLGFLISAAEPDLHILASQVDEVTASAIAKLQIVGVVSVGISVMLTVGLIRIVYNVSLKLMLTLLYGLVFLLALFTTPEFLAISFDSSGATTGALAVPFILAIAAGVASLKKDSEASEEDSFGLVAITSTGAILAVMSMSLLAEGKVKGVVPIAKEGPEGILSPFAHAAPQVAWEVFLALMPILILFLVLQNVLLSGRRTQRGKILIGLFYAYFGLVLLLTGVHAGFMEVGRIVGYQVALRQNLPLLIGIGFAMGLFTVIAEPAVHALTDQIQDVTSGYVRKKTVLGALSLGIGLAVALSMLRIMTPDLYLWHFLLPGYALSLLLMGVVPNLFVGIAFDSGGVASGPMTATFILAFAQGAAQAVSGADVLADGFGIIAMVAMTPLITLQLLGLIYKVKSRKGGVRENGNDN